MFPISRRRLDIWMVNVALVIICLFALIPVATTVLISFKGERDIIRKPPNILPCDTPENAFDPSACRWSVEGYQRVLAPRPSNGLLPFTLTGNIVRIYIPNSFMYATSTALLVVFLSAMSGYAFSRYRFRGREAMLVGILAITGVPLLTNLLALYHMGVNIRRAQLPFYDDRLFLIAVYTGFFLPLSVWIAKGFFDAIPRELEEAAVIDGCTPFSALVRISMPLALPGLMAIFLLTFVNVWNEFIAGYLLVAKNELKPAMFGLYEFLGQNIINLQVIAAACILIALPIAILFVFARRTFFT
ncbi:MAG: carbohydrate ABC transporter permease, partial [Caldilinea sp.]|nr:carbohydrate ABC transporter permease [Caldilinea sp.]MDW8442624.1 carbohydrate ABC transporter permease [Caldilineaceae bacterium]